MQAKDIMTTQVLTIQPDTPLKEAAKLLIEIEISGLIVTDENGDIVGVVTEKDLLVAYDFLQGLDAPVNDYINRDIISVEEETPVEEISKMLVTGDIRRVPVVKEKKVVGVISRRDVLKHNLKENPASS